MTNSVTVNGKTFTDDDSPTTGMGQGGFRQRLIPMLANAIIDLNAKVASALQYSYSAYDNAVLSINARNTAETHANNAAASATAAAGTQVTATAADNRTPGLGDKVFTIPAGKQLVLNTPMMAVSRSDANVWMYGTLKAYSGTSATLAVTVFGSAVAKTDWNLTISGVQGPAGPVSSNTIFTPVALATTIDCSNGNVFFKRTVAGAVTFAFANVPANGSAITLELQFDSGSIAFPASVKPPAGVWPTFVPGQTYICVLVTSNGGTSWRLSCGPGYSNG